MAHLDFEKPLAELEERIAQLKVLSGQEGGIDSQIRRLEDKARKLQRELHRDLTHWQKVQLSRHPDRPYFRDYLDRLFEDFVELHGDRVFGDDPAIIAGFGRFAGRTVAVIGQQKGRTTKQKLHRNFGMAHPEGYRKACRIMDMADRFGRPVLTFIDTPGAYPGLGAEERGQAEAIGHSLEVMARLGVPVVAAIIGEGGSGGALALGVANRVVMLQFATYSVITPEGCASILFRDGARGPEAAEQLKLLAEDVQRIGVTDVVVEEPTGGAHRDPDEAATSLGRELVRQLDSLAGLSREQVMADRYDRFRSMGRWVEARGAG